MKKSLQRREEKRDAEAIDALLRAPPPGYYDWLAFFFGRAGRDGDALQDPWKMEWDFEVAPEETAAFMAHAFVNSDRDLAPCSDYAVAVGLKALLDGSHTEVWKDVTSPSLEPIRQRAFVRSLRWLYSDCLAVRAPPVLGHLGESRGHPLEYITYMLWDVSPLDRLITLRDPTSNRSVLVETLGDVLQLAPANPACIESVLHGFGHMVGAFPMYGTEIRDAVDRFLTSRPILRPELAAYAAAAKSGCVL